MYQTEPLKPIPENISSRAVEPSEKKEEIFTRLKILVEVKVI